jgi:hypothetical protein
MNTGVSLSTSISPDEVGDRQPVLIGLAVSPAGECILRGTTDVAGSVVIDGATSLASPMSWRPLQTNDVQAGLFALPVPWHTNPSGFFRVRRP